MLKKKTHGRLRSLKISNRTPAESGYKYNSIFFKSVDKTKLHGWEIPATDKKAKGVVVFSHGNTGTMHSHFSFCYWLVRNGWHVFMYDYRGFGISEGSPNRRGVIEDSIAAFDYVLAKKEWKHLPVFSLGHSLGAAKSLVALGEVEHDKRIKGAAAWGGFASYVEEAKHMIGDAATQIVTDKWAPKDHVAKLSPMPLLVLHGKKDNVVPFEHAESLMKHAQEPKTLIVSEQGGHNDTLSVDDQKLRKDILKWFEDLISEKE